MATHCAEKQGTHLQVSGNGITPIDIVTGGGATSTQSSSSTVAYATWQVFTRTGSSSPTSRGFHGILSDNSFIVVNVWNSQRRVYFSRLTHTGAPQGSMRSWSSSQLSFFSHQIFSHGSLPVTTYTTIVRSPGGSILFNQSSTSGQFAVSEIECGCDNEDCQRGTFPSDFCCTNCAEQVGILSGILGALRG
jgi:hypothetical protein